LTNRGFVELHNPLGFFIVGIGFLLVMLIVAAGGIFSRIIERDNVERRRQQREAAKAAAEPKEVPIEEALIKEEIEE
jgi:flagellar basal body-associated protein FliL